MKEEKKGKYRICPYLGRRSDPGTALAYPAGSNCCTHAKPVAAIELGHQEEFCLTTGYPSCEEYCAEPDAALPAGLHGFSGRWSWKKLGNKKWVWSIVLLGLGIIVAWLFITRWGGFGQSSTVPTVITESTETSTEVSSPLPSLTRTPTTTPTFVDTATPWPPLGLETPLGIDHKFLIHQIQEGDSQAWIAGKYGTTIAALLACNYRWPSLLIPGMVVVVPLNFVDTQGLPAFEVYNVTKEISLEDLAILLSVDLNEFKYYNAIDDGFIPRVGDWLLVPRAGSPTP